MAVGKTNRPIKIMLFTVLAMTAFAGNSILCRFALGGGLIDAASFTSIRIGSGAIFLGFLCLFKKKKFSFLNKNKWIMPILLTTYALFFSYAYLSLGTGTGALVLFGAVQATMIISGWISGERMNALQMTGLFLALAGLVYLVFPGLSAPSPIGALLMGVAGIAWGGYSLLGRQSADPLETTASNFIYSVPILLVLNLFFISKSAIITLPGSVAAVTSGTLASGTGYVLWYAALKGLSSTRAAIVQLTVPVIAACGGMLFLSEAFSVRLLIASVIILSGVGLALGKKEKT